MTLDMIKGIIRTVVPALLAYLVGNGIITNDTVSMIVTVLTTLAAAGWSIYNKQPTQVVSQAAAVSGVEKIVATAALADAIPSAKVVTR